MSLDRLQKEIDALTYNARTVMNALIRSVTAAGDNQGFKATRVNEVIYLNRVDIYRLYKFYQEWSANEYSTVDVPNTNETRALDGFDTIRARHDETPVTIDSKTGEEDTTATSSALTKHGKILFKTADNVDNTDEQWIALVKNNNNPKLVSNSSPIPLNLRTPVFDENLSTAHYNQYPTYLFPSGYYTIDALGFSGDDTPHNLDGKSWTIDADDFLRFGSPEISMGGTIPDAKYKTPDKRTGRYAFSFGYDCHAQAAFSISGGRRSIVPSDEENDPVNSIAIGNANIASVRDSIAIGGRYNSVSNTYAGILGGYNNAVTSRSGSIIGGSDNVVGGKVYSFRFPTGVISDETATNTESDTGAEGEVTAANNVITVSGNKEDVFKAGQRIRIFDFRYDSDERTNNKYYQNDGSARKAISDTIGSVDPVTDENDPNFGRTKITLRKDIPEKGTITGGKISISVDENGINLGRYSAAIGRNLIAEGPRQLVIGSSNKVQRKARFLVGSGNTSNSFEVYNNKVIAYATPSTNNTFDVEEPTVNGSISTSNNFTGLEFSTKGLDTLVGNNRLRIFKDLYINSIRQTGFEFTGLIGNSESEFGIKANTVDGINLYTKNSDTNINMITGTESIDSFGEDLVKTGNIGVLSAKKVYIVGKEGVNITAANGSENTGILRLEWETSLTLVGDTFGTLPTDKDQYAHYIEGNITDINQDLIGTSEEAGIITFYKSGFYRVSGFENTIVGADYTAEENKVREMISGIPSTPQDYFLFNVGYANSANEYLNWQMLIGADPRITGDDVHIGVRRGVSYDNVSTNEGDNSYLKQNALNGNNIKYIGWLQDYQYIDRVTNTSVPSNVTFGKWTQLPESAVRSDRLESNGTLFGEASTNLVTDYSPIPTLLTNISVRYTKMNNLIFFSLKIKIPADYLDDQLVVMGIAIHPDQDYSDWSKILLPLETNKYPSFIDNRSYRDYNDAQIPSDRLYTCQVIENGDNTGEAVFLITTNAPSASGGDGFSTNQFTEDVNGLTLHFTGSYETRYSTTEEEI